MRTVNSMTLRFILSFFFSVNAALHVQAKQTINEITFSHNHTLCALNDHPKFDYTTELYAPAHVARKALQVMTKRLGIANNFRLLAGKFSKKVGAFTTIKNNRRYIIYDVDLYFKNNDLDNYWRSLGMLAHELHHQLAADIVLTTIDPHERELEADRFAGFMLAQFNATARQARLWTDYLNSNGSETHPPKSKRITATMMGWQQGRTQMKR